MTIHRIKFVLICLGISLQTAYAQDISTKEITWRVTTLKDLKNNSSSGYQCVFKTNGTQKISWIQNSGSYTTELVVEQTEGEWKDVKSVGSKIYRVNLDDLAGTIRFERKEQQVLITLDVSSASGDRLWHQFSVSEITSPN